MASLENMTDKSQAKPLDYIETDIPKLGGPAQRALFNAGLTSLLKISRVSEQEVADLHGMGPSTMKILKQTLKDKGKSFK